MEQGWARPCITGCPCCFREEQVNINHPCRLFWLYISVDSHVLWHWHWHWSKPYVGRGKSRCSMLNDERYRYTILSIITRSQQFYRITSDYLVLLTRQVVHIDSWINTLHLNIDFIITRCNINCEIHSVKVQYASYSVVDIPRTNSLFWILRAEGWSHPVAVAPEHRFQPDLVLNWQAQLHRYKWNTPGRVQGWLISRRILHTPASKQFTKDGWCLDRSI